MESTVRPYNALNGEEMIKIIGSQVEKALERSNEFSISKCYPQVSWKFRLELEVYPQEPSLEVHLAQGEVEAAEHPVITHEQPKKITVEHEVKNVGVEIAADQVREEEGLGVSEPTERGSTIVDELLNSLKGTGRKPR